MKKPTPLLDTQSGKSCPICGKTSYSLGGVHPQCVVEKADKEQAERRKLEVSKAQEAESTSKAKAWEKICPKCNAVQHVRKKECTCGYTFSNLPRPPAAGTAPK